MIADGVDLQPSLGDLRLESPLPVLAGESNLDLLAVLLNHVNALSPDRPRLDERDPLAFLPDP